MTDIEIKIGALNIFAAIIDYPFKIIAIAIVRFKFRTQTPDLGLVAK